MTKILTGLLVAVLMGLALSDGGPAGEERFTIQYVSWDQFVSILCNNLPQGVTINICGPSTTTSTSTQASTSTTPKNPPAALDASPTTPAIPTTTQSASPLEHAHWCQFKNGSYLSLYQKFLYDDCSVCQCTESHLIRCSTLTCMPTFCIDNSLANRRSGQCCSQCAYAKEPATCTVNGYTIPDGTIIQQRSDGVKCWCQSGTVECRKTSTTLLSSLDYWGKGTAVYVIVIVICVLVILGSLLCLGSGLFFYYYYKQDQQATQQAYEQYYNSAGWQPMGEDGQVVDPTAEEKKAEAEQYQYEYTDENGEYVPPPYAIHNGSYVNDYNEQGQQKS